MQSKWIIYFLTLISYALIHSIRSAWSSIKSMLDDEPYNMSTQFLGVLDMTVLFSLAVTLTIFGNQIQKYGPKKYLMGGMLLLIILSIIIAISLIKLVTSKIIYFLLYGLGIGIISASGWPSCLSILSKRFDKSNNVALPLWNGTSQLGDFIALFISDVIIQTVQANGAVTLIIIPCLMFVLLILNRIFLPKDTKQIQFQVSHPNELNEQKPVSSITPNAQYKQYDQKRSNQENQNNQNQQKISIQVQLQQAQNNKQIVVNQLKVPPFPYQLQMMEKKSYEPSMKSDSERQSMPPFHLEHYSQKKINFINVWFLPSVAGYVIASSMVKSVNAIVIAWIVFYLYKLDMKPQARIIAILWSGFVFVGGAVGGYINPKYSKKIFIVSLMISAVMFIFLQELHQRPNEFQIIITVIICALSYGGPYNMMSTAVPLMLSQKPEIKNIKGAKSAIIALMQGFGMLICGFSLLIVPELGVINMHWMAFFLCILAAMILSFQEYRQPKS